jgi:hypothetical protein
MAEVRSEVFLVAQPLICSGVDIMIVAFACYVQGVDKIMETLRNGGIEFVLAT